MLQHSPISAISIHALLAESDWEEFEAFTASLISIHALLAESDLHGKLSAVYHRYFYPRSPCGERLNGGVALPPHQQFLSTLSLRRATTSISSPLRLNLISIHALLAESDRPCCGYGRESLAFLSTLSLRRATHLFQLKKQPNGFLSTLSLRRATV